MKPQEAILAPEQLRSDQLPSIEQELPRGNPIIQIIQTGISGACVAIGYYFAQKLFAETKITAYEIVYFQTAFTAFALFSQLAYQGVYFLGIKESCRKVLIMKGIISLASIIMFFQSLHQLSNIVTLLTIQYGAFGVTYFFMLKPEERQKGLSVVGMGLSLITLTIQFIQTVGNQNATILDFKQLSGFALAMGAGIGLASISLANESLANQVPLALQEFYSNCISACFSPFLILMNISDSRVVPKYGQTEMKYLLLISLLAIIKTTISNKVKSTYSPQYSAVAFVLPLVAIAIITLSNDWLNLCCGIASIASVSLIHGATEGKAMLQLSS
ncbi:hypothetical protein FGO68_gene17774 [Halteria grandinella]|uniref:Uncharacterized protein n=1 Tax=Halteria grandinella TaxID=5974 RepID=A0A8J8NKK8_HALGN|nr:hypothetical protein FGO68_gene17774 [Halteria grandinella]